MSASELDPEFDRMCEEIKEARKKRDASPTGYSSRRRRLNPKAQRRWRGACSEEQHSGRGGPQAVYQQ
ncbi:hypothetical protein NHX12_034504 [Muraenolepis orangiensis]|uniref:Uncharacterized protein n=1 Tax=Muraenolepis orangiensis TaxID=630683 RepID=A0A9Q0I228_9TELE|nr:hypothetical protein NHX12_034504 [Muraenolepis orangiensis]